MESWGPGPGGGTVSGWGPRRSPCPSAGLPDLTFSPISVQRARSWLCLRQCANCRRPVVESSPGRSRGLHPPATRPSREDLRASLQAPPPPVQPWELVCSPPLALGWDRRWAPQKQQGDCQASAGCAARKARVQRCLLREPTRARGTATLKQESADSTPQLGPLFLPL